MNIIEVSNLSKRYGDTVAVHDVSFTVEPGEIFGILGPNGAGKTTTVEMIGGLRTPDSGSIRVLGLDPRRDRAEFRERVGIQLQDSELPERLRTGEALDLYRSFYRNPATPRTRGSCSRSWACRTSATPRSGSCPAGSASAWRSRWP